MSERGYFQIIIYKAYPHERETIMDILREEGVSSEEVVDEGQPLVLGSTYAANEMALDAYETIGSEIIERAPHTSFACWNDPKYEFPGGITMHTPELGRWQGDCDSSGNPYLTASRIKDLISTPDVLLREAGLPWDERLAELRKGLDAR